MRLERFRFVIYRFTTSTITTTNQGRCLCRSSNQLSSHFLQETQANGIVNVGDAVPHAITKTAGIARTVDVVRIVATIFATVESVSTAIADRFDAIFAKGMADGGRVFPMANGVTRTR